MIIFDLLIALQKAVKGKRQKASVIPFLFNQEKELIQLCSELQTQAWRPGGYRTFKIYDPKERNISAAPFRDRVVHHYLCLLIEPIFEKTFIHDSYANRIGKGTHKAINRFQYFARRYPFVLKCDIKKFFPSLDHEILKREIRWRVKDAHALWLCDTIIDGSNPQEEVMGYFQGDDLFSPIERKRGLPIGNLTSQFWANVYMNRFDHFVKEVLQVKGYIRYVDDFVLFANTKMEIHEYQKAITHYLDGIRLQLHPRKTQLYRVQDGVPFLGFRVFPYYRYVLKEKTKRYKRFLKKKIKYYQAGKITPAELENAINAWLGHIRFGQSQRLEYQVFWILRNAGINVHRHPNGAWKILEIKK